MSEANGTGPTVIVVPAGEETPVVVSEGGEIQAPAAVEEVSDAAVQIAEIEADRDIALAVIRNEGEAEWNEARQNEELQSCRLRIAELEGENTALKTELEQRPPLIQVLSPEPLPNPEPEPAPVVEAVELEPVESPAEAPEPEKPRRKALRWI